MLEQFENGCENGPSGRDDALACFAILHDRRPESECVLARLALQPVQQLLRDGLASAEFEQGVVQPILRGEQPRHHRHSPCPTQDQVAWLSGWLGASAELADRLGSASTWRGFFLALLAHPALSALVPALRTAAGRSAFARVVEDEDRATAPLVAEPGEPAAARAGRRRITISILSVYGEDLTGPLLSHLPALCERAARRLPLEFEILVRNHAPSERFAALGPRLEGVGSGRTGVRTSVLRSPRDFGFGGGHVENLAASSGEFFLALDNDLELSSLDWLGSALRRFDEDPRLAVLGSASAPWQIAGGDGTDFPTPEVLAFSRAPHATGGPILLMRSEAVQQFGLLDADLSSAMYEHSDWAAALRASGMRVGTIDISHQHRRGRSFGRRPHRAWAARQRLEASKAPERPSA